MASCRSCNAPIEWTVTPAGKRMPVDVATGESHFATCPHANDWRRQLAAAPKEQRDV